MDRRTVMTGMLGTAAASLWMPPSAFALGLPKDKIKRIRYYKTPTDAAGRPNIHQPTFNQSTNIVTIETESGLMGIGEGGEPSTMEQCAGLLIGEDPFRIQHLWQVMERGYFYPPAAKRPTRWARWTCAVGPERQALGVPVWRFWAASPRLHGCYATSYPTPPGGTLEDAARACVAEGFRAYRTGVRENQVFDRFEAVRQTVEDCQAIRRGVGKDGAWAIDFHGTMDPQDAVTLATALEPLRPFFCEDLIRGENIDIYKTLRPRLRVPIAVGEIYGVKWEMSPLIEQNLIDFARCTVPNVGGITEYMKIAALCETHYCGMIPHFTGPIGETALVHCLTATSVIALMEMTSAGRKPWPYLPQAYDFHDGKLWSNDRPGLGVTLDASKLQMVGDWTEHYAPIQLNHRPDGSYTNW